MEQLRDPTKLTQTELQLRANTEKQIELNNTKWTELNFNYKG